MSEPTTRTINPLDLHRLEGDTAIVTGSTRGIGEGIARRFAAEGASVVVTGRSVDDGEAVAADIRAAGGEATFVETDLTDPDAIEALATGVAERYGSIDVLVNNAAAWKEGPFDDVDLDDWELVMAVSLRAPWLLTRAAVPEMPSDGRVINISSVLGTMTDPVRFPYDVSKSALNGLTRSLAVNLSDHGITVNGLVLGDIVKQYQDDDPHDQSNWEARLNPAGRRGVPADVAAVAGFLASDEAGFVTGASIPVDGGRLAALASGEWPGTLDVEPDEETG